MNLKIFYDTETQGLPDFKAPSDAEHQPHIVQIACALVDCDARKTVASMDVIVLLPTPPLPLPTATMRPICSFTMRYASRSEPPLSLPESDATLP